MRKYRNDFLVLLFIALFIGFFIFLFNYDPLDPEEKNQIAEIQFQLKSLEVGDILEFKNGEIALVSDVIRNNSCRYIIPIIGRSPRETYEDLAKRIARVYKQNTEDWKRVAILYCTPPYN